MRNLEVVAELAGERAGGVLLITEEPVAELTQQAIRVSTPHLDESAREMLRSRYLGQTTWKAAGGALAVDFATLPRTLADVVE